MKYYNNKQSLRRDGESKNSNKNRSNFIKIKYFSQKLRVNTRNISLRKLKKREN